MTNLVDPKYPAFLYILWGYNNIRVCNFLVFWTWSYKKFFVLNSAEHEIVLLINLSDY